MNTTFKPIAVAASLLALSLFAAFPSRARLCFLVPVVALLLGGMHLLAPAYAYAQTSPSVPRNVQVTPGAGKLTLTWQAPSSWGTRTAIGYSVEWQSSSNSWISVLEDGSTAVFGTERTRFEFAGTQLGGQAVTNGTSYDLRIRAVAVDTNTGEPVFSGWITVSNNVPMAAAAVAPAPAVAAAPAAVAAVAPAPAAAPVPAAAPAPAAATRPCSAWYSSGLKDAARTRRPTPSISISGSLSGPTRWR